MSDKGRRIGELERGFGEIWKCPACHQFIAIPDAEPPRKANEDPSLAAAEQAYADAANRTPIPAPFLEAEHGD
jgi:hypothetical protein